MVLFNLKNNKKYRLRYIQFIKKINPTFSIENIGLSVNRRFGI